MLDKIKAFLLEHRKIILYSFLGLFLVINLWGYISSLFSGDKNPTIVQPSSTPINLNNSGTSVEKPAPVYVYVGAKTSEQVTAKVEEKEVKDSPDVVVNDEAPTYRLKYNDKTFLWKSPVDETYKFENGVMTLNRTSTLDVNVEVPQPQWSIGVGTTFKGDVAIKGDLRIGKTPFNVWGYASPRDTAVGIAFTQYSSGGKKVEKVEKVKEIKKDENSTEKGREKESTQAKKS